MSFVHFKFQLLHSDVAYMVFFLLHEMLLILVIKKLCEFEYVNLLKQVKF